MKYKPDYHDAKLLHWVGGGGTLRGACRDLEISFGVAKEWLSKHKTFQEAYQKALARGHALYEERALLAFHNPDKAKLDKDVFRILKANFTASVESMAEPTDSPEQALRRILTVLSSSSEAPSAQVASVMVSICEKLHNITEVEELKKRIEALEDTKS